MRRWRQGHNKKNRAITKTNKPTGKHKQRKAQINTKTNIDKPRTHPQREIDVKRCRQGIQSKIRAITQTNRHTGNHKQRNA